MFNLETIAYNEAAIQNIRRMLEVAQQNGTPLYYEFSVDAMRLIPPTQNIAVFDSFRSFLHPGVGYIEFKIYQSLDPVQLLSTFTYSLKTPNKEQKELSGVEMEERMLQKVDKLQLEFQIRELERELSDSRAMIEDQEKWIEELTRKGESLKEQLEQEKNSLKGLIKEVMPYAPGLIKALPGLADTAPATATDTPSKMSFSLQGDPSQNGRESSAQILHNLTEEEQKAMRYYVGMGKKLEEELSQEELELFIRIAEVLYQHPDKIKTLAQLLDIDPAQDEDHL